MPIGLAEELAHPDPIAGIAQVYAYDGVAYVELGDGTIVEMGSVLTKRAVITHIVAVNTAGGATAANAWTAMPLTNIRYNEGGLSLGIGGVGTITLNEPGHYSVKYWTAMMALTSQFPQTRIRDTTNNRTLVASSVQGLIIAGGTLKMQLVGEGEFDLATSLGHTVPALLELQYYTTVAQAVNGLGDVNTTAAAEDNWLRVVTLTKHYPMT